MSKKPPPPPSDEEEENNTLPCDKQTAADIVNALEHPEEDLFPELMDETNSFERLDEETIPTQSLVCRHAVTMCICK